jgi:flagellar protein FliS
MPTESNPYQAYTDGSVFSDNPLNLVIALYQGALDATHQAERALRAGDIMARGRAINRANAILSELLMSLDHERGGEISLNLKSLYCYMQGQLLAAHVRKSAEPIVEVASLLANLLEGWRAAAQAPDASLLAARMPASNERAGTQTPTSSAPEPAPFYGGYADESAAARLSSAYSF